MTGQHLFKALADPTRRDILKLLRSGSQSAGDIADHFTITKASLSHHFNLLKQAELVRTERRGQHIVYSLNTSVMEDAATMLVALLSPTQENTLEDAPDDI
ncbi:MAG: autorepressor SdpR family transcription factor [Pseudomonadota bacterium]